MKEVYDVAIIGGGPVGCNLGKVLSRDNHKVLIIEKKQEIGTPVKCTGLVSHRIFELTEVDKNIVVNKLKKCRFCSPCGNYVEMRAKELMYIIDREKFDKKMEQLAIKNRTEIRKSTSFENYRIKDNVVKIKTNRGVFESKILVGADGPNSSVAKAANIVLPDNLVVGIQKTINSNYKKDIVELWFGGNIAPGFFAWVVPESEEWARVGVATSNNPNKYFENFVKRRIQKSSKSRDDVYGVIRYGLIKSSVSDRVLLVGDAAAQVKPFSGGGIVYGLIGSEYAYEACKKALESNKYDYEFFKEEYDKKWKSKLAWPIIQGFVGSKVGHAFPDWLLDSLAYVGNFFKPVYSIFDPDFIIG